MYLHLQVINNLSTLARKCSLVNLDNLSQAIVSRGWGGVGRGVWGVGVAQLLVSN